MIASKVSLTDKTYGQITCNREWPNQENNPLKTVAKIIDSNASSNSIEGIQAKLSMHSIAQVSRTTTSIPWTVNKISNKETGEKVLQEKSNIENTNLAA